VQAQVWVTPLRILRWGYHEHLLLWASAFIPLLQRRVQDFNFKRTWIFLTFLMTLFSRNFSLFLWVGPLIWYFLRVALPLNLHIKPFTTIWGFFTLLLGPFYPLKPPPPGDSGVWAAPALDKTLRRSASLHVHNSSSKQAAFIFATHV